MVLPFPVVCVKCLGWMHGLLFITLSNRQADTFRSADVTSSSVGSPAVLLAYRLFMLVWALSIGLRQLARRGTVVFVYFTVWNWWLLTLFFALASASSLRAAFRRRRRQQQPAGADWLDKATVAAFTIEMPMTLIIDGMTWLVLHPMLMAAEQDPQRRAFWHAIHHNFESYNMTMIIDSLTWLVLVPMLMESSDPARIAFWRQRLYCFESYNQHGFNAAMMLGDLLLNRIPVTFFASGWLAVWTSLFGVWSGVFYVKTGRFIYPFLDAHKPYAWVSYIGLFALHWAAYLFVMALARAKEWLLLRDAAPVVAEPAAPPSGAVNAMTGQKKML